MKKRIKKGFLLLVCLMFCACGQRNGDAADTAAVQDTSAELLSYTDVSEIPDGNYWITVSLEGGSGRASIASPTGFYVKDGQASADIHWSSANYDYMRVDGEIYTAFADADTGHSVMTIPVSALDTAISVTADTTAMSKPYEIDYTLTFHGDALLAMSEEPDHGLPSADVQAEMDGALQAQEASEHAEQDETAGSEETDEDGPVWSAAPEIDGLTFCSTDVNDAAVYFRLSRYQDAEGRRYTLLETNGGTQRYLLVPAGAVRTDFTAHAAEANVSNRETAGDAVVLIVLQQPLTKIYEAASAVMAPICDMGAVGQVRFSALSSDSWYVEEARSAMESGQMKFAGKYSEPDFEALLQEGCDLAMESTMIYHVPEVKEKLEALGIPVYVDYASYEPHVLGRVEWLRAYGALLGHEEEAAALYQDQREGMRSLQAETQPAGDTDTRPTVVYFYINTAGQVRVRQPKDYIPELLEMAGARYLYGDTTGVGSRKSYITISAEDFYQTCKDADYLIYSATLDRPLDSMAELIGKSALFSDFKAVKAGQVYTTNKDFYQLSDRMADFAEDVRRMLRGREDMEFLQKVD